MPSCEKFPLRFLIFVTLSTDTRDRGPAQTLKPKRVISLRGEKSVSQKEMDEVFGLFYSEVNHIPRRTN
jgi:hypothetical protein